MCIYMTINFIMTKNKILTLSCIAALLFGLVDAVVDYYAHSDESFVYILLYDIEKYYFRLLVAAAFMVFGLFLSKMFTAKERTLSLLKENEYKYQTMLESIDDSIYVVDTNYNYCYINSLHLHRLGQTEEIIGKGYGEFHSSEETKLFIEKMNKAVNTGKSATYTHKSFREGRYFMQTYSPFSNESGEITKVTITSKEVTKIKKMEELMKKASMTDEMTGLHNRRGFFALAEHNFKMIKRSNNRSYLLYVDMDNLKKINDHYGHNEGDAAIVTASNILKATYRDTDIIARVGGDEFIIFPVETSEDSYESIVSRLQRNLDIYNTSSNLDYELSLSVGIALINTESLCNIDELIAQADKLMYESKLNKKQNHSSVYS